MANKDVLYQWLFHYNPYDDCWHAFVREDYIGYFGSVPKKYPDLKAKNMKVLTDIIISCEGNPEKITAYLETI